MTDPITRLARNYTARAEIEARNLDGEPRQAVIDLAYAGGMDDDPRHAASLARAEHQLSCVGHAQDAKRRNDWDAARMIKDQADAN